MPQREGCSAGYLAGCLRPLPVSAPTAPVPAPTPARGSAAVGTRPWRRDSRRGASARVNGVRRAGFGLGSTSHPPLCVAGSRAGGCGEVAQGRAGPGGGRPERVGGRHVTRPRRTWPGSPTARSGPRSSPLLRTTARPASSRFLSFCLGRPWVSGFVM